jgi:hypothetical protein
MLARINLLVLIKIWETFYCEPATNPIATMPIEYSSSKYRQENAADISKLLTESRHATDPEMIQFVVEHSYPSVLHQL